MFSLNRGKTFSDQIFTTPSSSPQQNGPATSDNLPQDCRGISSSVTILRPRSPTKCSTEEKGLMEFVERGVKDSYNTGVPCPWEDIVCALAATFLFRSSSGAFIPDVDMQMFWCNFCSFKSKEKREMIQHSMSHRFKCNYCDYECFTRFDVVKHSVKTHPEYKLTRHALKACMLLRDLIERDENAMLFGGKNLETDKTESNFHLEYDQQSSNSNHGSSNGGDMRNSPSTAKLPGAYSIFQRNFNDNSNDTEMTTLPLTISESRSLVDFTQSFGGSNSNGINNLFSSENNPSSTDTGTMGLITDVRSTALSSENNIRSIHPLISSTDETGLQIVDVQSNSLEANLLTFSPPKENETTSLKTQDVNQQDSAKETIQLLEGLINTIQATGAKAKESQKTADAAASSVSGISEVQTSKRKTTEILMESSAEEDSDADPDYQPESLQMKSERASRRKKKKIETRQSPKASSDKKPLDIDCLRPDTVVWNCGYCRYRTLKKKKIESHITEKHSPKAMKYTKWIVNSKRELVPESEIKTKSFTPKSKMENKEDDNDDGDTEKTKDKYACMFCNYKSANVQIIRQHMFRLHPSKKFCCIDNSLKQTGKKHFYTFFCCRHKCNYLSTDPNDYIEHVEKCTPLPKLGTDEASKPTGLQQSVIFAKSLQNSDKNEVDGDRASTKRDRESKKEKDKDSKKDTSDDSGEQRDYSCHRCSFSAKGDEVIKAHILAEHPNFNLIALVKRPDSSLDFYMFCPEEKCKYVTQRRNELDIHRKQNHSSDSSSTDNEKKDIKPLVNLDLPKDEIEKNTMTYMPAYECLYCETSCITTSLMNMKRHVQDVHPDEVIIIRDCVAYKRKRPSRIYVCNSTGCIFNDLDYKEYLTHTIAHEGGTLYGCANCNWVAKDKREFEDHVKRQKGVKHSLVETRVKMKDDGSIVKETV